MADYVVGQVASVLAKPGAETIVNEDLNALFSYKPKVKPKRKEEPIEEQEPPTKRKKSESAVSKIKVDWGDLTGAERRIASKELNINDKRKKRDKSRDNRTIFVGNLPVNIANKMRMKKLFSKYGEIENLRFRCPPTKNFTTSKRVTMIRKEFHPDKKNMIAYVCFKEEFSAEKALQMNGKEVDGHHLRVDISSENKKTASNTSVFVGNLPFDIDEESMRKKFEVCGTIDNIRIVRDNNTGYGKGFGYVVFKKKDGVELALKLNGEKLKKREMRVKRCLKTKANKMKSDQKAPQLDKKEKKKTFSVKNSYQGIKATRNKKDKFKKKKMKKTPSNARPNFKKHLGEKGRKPSRFSEGRKKDSQKFTNKKEKKPKMKKNKKY